MNNGIDLKKCTANGKKRKQAKERRAATDIGVCVVSFYEKIRDRTATTKCRNSV